MTAHAVWIPDLFKWAGAALLMQSLLRDLYLVSTQELFPRKPAAPPRAGSWICLESGLGIALLLVYALLASLGTAGEVRMTTARATALLSAWWLFGYAIKDLVLELRREPDHLNLIVAFSRPKTGAAPRASE